MLSLGKPYEPNAIIKNDMEFILMQRKPDGYRKPTEAQRAGSRIPKEEFDRLFQWIHHRVMPISIGCDWITNP
jgi:modification methylase